MNIIRVKAFPESKKPFIEETSHQVLRIFIREPAQNNQANKAVLDAVAEHYTIPRTKLKMISGHRSLNKMIQILE